MCLCVYEYAWLCVDCARKVTLEYEGNEYNDGLWHQVTVRRRGINATLQVTHSAGVANGNYDHSPH